MANYILVMDQGTTGSRDVVYDEKGKTVAIDYEEYEQFFPNSGWWEQSGIGCLQDDKIVICAIRQNFF